MGSDNSLLGSRETRRTVTPGPIVEREGPGPIRFMRSKEMKMIGPWGKALWLTT